MSSTSKDHNRSAEAALGRAMVDSDRANSKGLPDKLKTFLLTGSYTLAQISEHMGKQYTRDMVWRQAFGGLAGQPLLFEQRDRRDMQIFSLVPQSSKTIVSANWYSRAADKNHPYMWVQFHFGWNKFDSGELPQRIRIFPITDVHYGAKAHSAKRFKDYLKYILENDDAYATLNGDIIDNALPHSVGASVMENIMTPSEQLWGTDDGKEPGIIAMLKPLADAGKLLFGLPGNHCWRSWVAANLDPCRIMCRELGIQYFSEPVCMDVLAWGQRFTFYFHHGVTGSGTPGGKLNAAGKPLEWAEHHAFTFMGHVHTPLHNEVSRIVRKRTFDKTGKLVKFGLEERSQLVAIGDSHHSFYSTYASRAGFSPSAWGAQALQIFHDGSYRITE